MDKLAKKVADFERAGMIVKVVSAPKEAYLFDKMIVVWLPRDKPFLYQVHLWNSQDEVVVSSIV